MASTPQPRVPPESPSWCIDAFALAHYERTGEIVQKAHRVKDARPRWRFRPGTFHQPVCGASVEHIAGQCAPAPAFWPACRHCWRRADSDDVPAVFHATA